MEMFTSHDHAYHSHEFLDNKARHRSPSGLDIDLTLYQTTKF